MNRTALGAVLVALCVAVACVDFGTAKEEFCQQRPEACGAPTCEPRTSQPCYEGPSGTQSVGVCVAGSRTCLDDGSGYGACIGQVVPVNADECSTGRDSNCDGRQTACTCEVGDTLSCYEGAAGTEGVGACKGGLRSCVVQSGELGSCVGQVLPALEVCDNSVDENCDDRLCVGDLFWAKRFEVPLPQTARLAVHPSGDVIVAGTYFGSLTLDGQQLEPASNGTSLFVARYAPNRTLRWVRTLANSGSMTLLGLATNEVGRIFLAGSHAGTLTVQPTAHTSTGQVDGYLLVLEEDGKDVVQHFAEGPGSASVNGVVAERDWIYVVGEIPAGTTSFYFENITSEGLRDVFLARIRLVEGAAGNTYLKRFGHDLDQNVTSIAFDFVRRRFAFAGMFQGGIGVDGEEFVSAGGQDVFVAVYTADGVKQWARRLGGVGNQSEPRLTYHPDGRLAVALRFGGQVSLGGETFANDGGANELDIGWGVLATDGGHLSSTHVGGPGRQVVTGVAARTEDVTFVGQFTGTLQFDRAAEPLSHAKPSPELFVVRTDWSGARIFQVRRGVSGDLRPQCVALDVQGNAYVAGDAAGETEFDELGNMDPEDAFFLKVSR